MEFFECFWKTKDAIWLQIQFIESSVELWITFFREITLLAYCNYHLFTAIWKNNSKAFESKRNSIQTWLISRNFSKCSQFLHSAIMYSVQCRNTRKSLPQKTPKLREICFIWLVFCILFVYLCFEYSYFMTIADCIKINMDGSILFQ